MGKDDQVLSQAEIDALVSRAPEKPDTPVATAEAPEEKPVEVPTPEPAAP